MITVEFDGREIEVDAEWDHFRFSPGRQWDILGAWETVAPYNMVIICDDLQVAIFKEIEEEEIRIAENEAERRLAC